MANSHYRPFLETALAPGNAGNGHGGLTIDLLAASGTSEIAVALVDTVGGYTFSVDHQFVSGLGTNIVSSGTSNIENQTFIDSSNGVGVDADDLTMTSVGDGTETVNALVIYDNQSASADQQPLLVYVDTGTGFGFTPNGSTVEITWAGAPNYIFAVGV